HAAVLDETAGVAVLELDGVAPGLAAVGADSAPVVRNGHAAHRRPRPKALVICRKTGESGGERAMRWPRQRCLAPPPPAGGSWYSHQNQCRCSTSDSRSVTASHLSSAARFVRWHWLALAFRRVGCGCAGVRAAAQPPARALARPTPHLSATSTSSCTHD
ncbi:hypothetical protein THAOC_23631, partial [Thalassiosira oceanica]